MDYKRIHDLIIERARSRTYDSKIHQNHHIIPVHEDPSSTEVVPLTYKEHYIVHLLRWKFVGTLGNYRAYLFMRGQEAEARLLASSAGGRVGGANTKANRSGIFSDDWDRSEETRRRWEQGIISREAQSELMKSGLASKAGTALKEQQKGIFSPDWDRSENNKQYWANMPAEEKERRDALNKKNASLGGKTHTGKVWVNNGVDCIRLKPEIAVEYLSNGWVRGRGPKNIWERKPK